MAQVGIYDFKGQLIYVKDAGYVDSGNVIFQVKPDTKLLPGFVLIVNCRIDLLLAFIYQEELTPSSW